MAISVGEKIPEANLMLSTDEGPKPVTSTELFSGKKVVMFAVPGAFTPTCSAKHLPGFLDHVDQFKSKGVDEVVCLSVNDVFVMDAWGKDQSAGGKVTMAADGNGAFTTAMGLELDGSGFGMGKRSQRYALYAEDGVIKVLNVEPGPGLEVSSAETMLAAI
jgi:peroxiredoxin